MTSQPGYPAPGELIGPYRIGRRLGGGGMGVVFEAYDEGRLYIATQLVPDGDLGLMLQAYGAPPVRTALDVIAQVATGLADAHDAGLVHRDIKPANVLLRRRDATLHAYLADFGIARQVGAEATRTTTGTIGTPSYMAPELHTGGRAGVPSDVYSLGCLLWATLSGTAPYTGTSDYEIVSAHIARPVPQLPGESPLVVEVNRILRTAMARQPGDRYPTAAAMRDDLRGALRLPDAPPVPGSLRLAAPGPGAGPAAGHRGRIALLVALVVLLVAAGGGIAYALTRGDDGGDTATDPPGSSTSTTAPTDPGSPVASPDERRAVDSFATALAATSVMSEKQSRCVARTVVDDLGLPTLVEDGFFDAEGTFLDPDLAGLPAEKESLSAASLSCLTLD